MFDGQFTFINIAVKTLVRNSTNFIAFHDISILQISCLYNIDTYEVLNVQFHFYFPSH